MGRYILRFTGSGSRPAADLRRLRASRQLTVLDESARMLLVAAEEKEVKRLIGSMPGWTWTPERSIRLPDTRVKPRRGPKDRPARG